MGITTQNTGQSFRKGERTFLYAMVLKGTRGKGKLLHSSGAQHPQSPQHLKITSERKAPAPSEGFTSVKQKKASIKSAKQMASLNTTVSDSEEDDNVTNPTAICHSTAVPTSLLRQFEKMLHKALQTTSDQITNSLTKEIRELGGRTEVLETKMDDLEAYTQDCVSEIDTLKEENLILQNRLEEFENRARRSNLRFRGLPESIIDLNGTMLALCQEILPGIPADRLEMDRVHRALTSRKADGPPRDIIAKFHFYRTKELILQTTREKSKLTFQGNEYQIFADISQMTINKRREMRPLLYELQQRQIKYQWGFPFSLRFTCQGTKIVCRTPAQLQQALLDFKIIDRPPSATAARRRSASTSPRDNSPLHNHNNGIQQLHKRGRFVEQAQEQEDTMD